VIVLGLSLWLWALLLIDVAALMWCAETESPFVATFLLAATALVAEFVFGIAVFATVIANPLTIVLVVLGYLVAGVLWAYPKWWFFVRNIRDDYLDSVRSFLRGKGYEEWESAKAIPDDYLAIWWDGHGVEWGRKFPVKARDHKRKIITWMAWWPVSMVWTLINDPIRKLYRYTYEVLRGTFDRVGASAMGDVEIQDRPMVMKRR